MPTKTCKVCAKTHKLTHDPHRGNFCALRTIFSVVGLGAILVLTLILIGALVLVIDLIQTNNSERQSQLAQAETPTRSGVDTNPVTFPDNKLESMKSPYDGIDEKCDPCTGFVEEKMKIVAKSKFRDLEERWPGKKPKKVVVKGLK